MTELTQLLLDCLKKDCPVDGHRFAALGPENWQTFLALAADQRVQPLLWHRLKQKGLVEVCPDEVAATLREALRQNAMRNLRRYGELRCLLTALQTEDIQLILLKGIYLAETVYDSIGLREMNDIDVLARQPDLRRVAAILESMGYASPQPICPEVTVKTNHHLPPLIKNGYATFEIHWNLVIKPGTCSTDPDELWEHAVPTRIAGCPALVLTPEDLLLHLCLHTSYQHQFAFGLRPFCDIAAAIDHFNAGLDWQTVIERAEGQGWQRGVYLALRLARDLLGAAVPAAALERLQPVDMSEAVLDITRSQVFTDKYLAASIPESFAALLATPGLFGRLCIFWQRVFLPKAMMAAIYSVPLASVKIYGCYPRRIVDLLGRYRPVLRKYRQNGDDRLPAIVGRKNLISAWLAGPTERRCRSFL